MLVLSYLNISDLMLVVWCGGAGADKGRVRVRDTNSVSLYLSV